MARLARIVIPGLPHFLTQRGNRRGQTVFQEGDDALYLDLLAESSAKPGAEVWAYGLIPNNVHIILVPSDEDGLRRTLADLHRRDAGFVNACARTTGHVWQGRYGSVAMDEAHLLTAVRFVSLKPVGARPVRRAKDWTWSSVRAHLSGIDDTIVTASPLPERVEYSEGFLGETTDEDAAYASLRRSETVG